MDFDAPANYWVKNKRKRKDRKNTKVLPGRPPPKKTKKKQKKKNNYGT